MPPGWMSRTLSATLTLSTRPTPLSVQAPRLEVLSPSSPILVTSGNVLPALTLLNSFLGRPSWWPLPSATMR
eukprot:5537554-Pyramimonas_sp.AAC.1